MYMETNEKKWCVYMHINKINNKSYIGITSNKPENRWGNCGDGYKRNPAMWGAIQKYGWDSFEHIIWADKLSEKEAKEWEIRLIMLFQTNCCKYRDPSYGYNLTDGGEGMCGHIFSEEHRAKIRAARLGSKASDETKKKLSEIRKGRKLSEESKKKISDAHKAEKNINYGKSLSEETKNKLSNALSGSKNPMYGKKRPMEIIEKMVQGRKKMLEDKDYRDKMSKKYSEMYFGENNPKAHKVVKLTIDGVFIEIFGCIKYAAESVGVNESSIRGCCNGKQKTSTGFKWMYIENYERILSENEETCSLQ